MNVLVTGGTGYIGSHTVVELLNKGYSVTVMDNLYNSKADVVDKIESITGKRPEFVKLDMLDVAGVNELFASHNFDWVIHFAGLKAVGESCEKPLLYYHTNLTGTLNILNAMQAHGVKKIVFSSSATVYGEPERLPLDEDCALSFTNPYGGTKYMIEFILKDLCKADPSFTAVLPRYFNPVGAHESGLLGENPKGIPNNLTPYIARVALGVLKDVKVFGDDYDTPDGTGVRDYIHVVDLAKGHIAAIENVKDKGASVFNLGTGNGYSVLDVIKAFERACGKPIAYTIAPRRAGDVASNYANPQKANDLLKWHATLNIDDMASSMWNFIQKNPPSDD